MKKSFLDGLVGLSEDDAVDLCKKEKLKVNIGSSDDVMIAIAVPKTVIISVENNEVKSAYAGDPCEIEN